jgi:hypothetical protein
MRALLVEGRTTPHPSDILAPNFIFELLLHPEASWHTTPVIAELALRRGQGPGTFFTGLGGGSVLDSATLSSFFRSQSILGLTKFQDVFDGLGLTGA